MKMQEEGESPTGSPGPSSSKKRRYARVSRACNECRVRKIRCNGRQPCEPCEDFERYCTFTSTRGQRMSGAPRTKILEDRLRRARALITRFQALYPSAQLNLEVNSIFDSPPGSPTSTDADGTGPLDVTSEDHLENMLDGKGRITSTKNSTEYYGGGSGFAFLQQTQLLFHQDSPTTGLRNGTHLSLDAMSRLFDSPLPDKQALATDIPISKLLPSRQAATELLHAVFGQTYQLLQFLHEPTFQKQTDRIYNLDPMDFEDSDHDFLPLFYSVTALGYLFHQKMHHRYGCKGAVNQAMRHFIASRRMVDLERCRDISTLQTLLCFILFLISTARLATAHTFIGLAVAAALRMGLHSQASCEGLSHLEKDIRRRTFWTIVKLDIYSGTVLGLPGMIRLDYVDQPKPSGHIREYANEDWGGFVSLSTRRMFAASAKYLEILMILSKVVQKLYPKTDSEAQGVSESKKIYVSNNTILEIESEFEAWRDGLSDSLGLTKDNNNASSIVYELEMVHNFGYILLYRPFLHYLAKAKSENPPDGRLLRCAACCVKVSRLTISRSNEMLQKGFLAPAAWQSVYTVFLSLVTLIFFLATQHGNMDYAVIQKETEIGVRILARTSCQDIGSRRCLDVLRVLTRRLSHIINLDIDEISAGVQLYCQDSSGGAAVPKPRSSSGDADIGLPDGSAGMGPNEAMGLPGNQQYMFQSPSGSLPGPPLHSLLNATPIYPPEAIAYPIQPPIWEQAAGWQNGGSSPYLTRTSLRQASPPPSVGVAESLTHSDMEVPYTDGFAWPFQMTAHMANGRHNSTDGSQPQPEHHGLTPQDIAAFMRINPGDEPFL
ncbi:fungal transcriptional regulatory protein [Fonsecaea pedrosoi]|nr:fungal transcriptional regulatory protein [Fonsecaea pedrosoi]